MLKRLIEIIERVIKNREKDKFRKITQEKAVRLISPSLVVLNGPFKGLKYPSVASAGSTFFPKILGSYEKELHAVIEMSLIKNYDVVIDIGSAEGYYAVGFGLKSKADVIYAFDTDRNARELSLNMIKFNDLNERQVIVGELCDKSRLTDIVNGKYALVICDAEGYEKTLFDKAMAETLANCDVLVETHDCFEIGVSTYIENVFRHTHSITTILSVDDIQKIKYYEYKELEIFSEKERLVLLEERRASAMEWLYLEPKMVG